jgi:hypothetical protein
MFSRTPLDVFSYLREYEYRSFKATGLENVGASTSHNPISLQGLVQG